MLTPLLVFLFMVNACHCGGEKLKPISVSALGRTFSLGDLYDRRSETILQGPKLWNHEELVDYDRISSYGTEFQICSSMNINEAMTTFDLDASVKMSFMSGLISVAGAAGYLDDRKHKNNQARVSLAYKSTTFKRSLKPELFTRITYPEVLKKAVEATDVVAAIQYGAGAIFTFDSDVAGNEKKRVIEGSLQIAVKKIPGFSIEGSGKINMTEEERKKAERFSCKFHGDFILKSHPGTYEEAIKVYKELPSLLGEDYKNSVPITVWLYPIEKLPVEKASQMVYDITQSLVSSVTDVFLEIEELKRECNDILDTAVSQHHNRIRSKVEIFKWYLSRYLLQFKEKLSKMLPDIRKGTMHMSELTNMIKKKESSPFSKRKLHDWLSFYKEEVAVLSKIQSFPNYCRNDGDFSSKLLNNVRFTIGLTLQIGNMDKKYLNAMEHYLTGESIYRSTNDMASKWWNAGSEVLADLYLLSATFHDFYKRITSKTLNAVSGIQFLVREKIMQSDVDRKRITIELYDRAVLKDSDYQLTSAPGKPKVTEKTYQSISLAWAKPTKGVSKLKHYKLTMYTLKKYDETKGCTEEFCKVSEVTVRDITYTVNGLRSQIPYFFTVSAYTELGETGVSVMSDEIVTNRCPPGTYNFKSDHCKLCEPGTFSEVVGMAACAVCPAGTYNPIHGATSSNKCTKCAAGTYNTKEGSKSKDDCVACSIGTHGSQSGADHEGSCQKCGKGTYGDQKGLTSCKKCKTDGYSPEDGQSSCIKCPKGTHTKSPGAVSSSECLGIEAAEVAKREIGEITSKIEKSFTKLKTSTAENLGRVQEATDRLQDYESMMELTIDEKVGGVLREVEAIHNCKWMKGEGTSYSEDRHTIPGKLSRAECIYKCKCYGNDNPDLVINGVTRKLSTGSCMCVPHMRVSPSGRYEYCKM